MRPNIQALLFDLDGTLLDTAPDLTNTVNITLKQHNKATINLAQLRPHVSLGSPHMLYAGFGIHTDDPQYHNIRQQFLDNYNEGDYFKIEEIKINFTPINENSPYIELTSDNQRLMFLYTRRWNNLLKQKPINTGLPDSKEEAKAIKKMIEEGESRQRIFSFFQRSESVLHDIIKKNLEGRLDEDDPYAQTVKRIFDQND